MEGGSDAETLEAGVGDEAEVLAHVAEGEAGDSSGEEVFGELGLAVDGLVEHGDDLGFEAGVPEIGLLGSDDVDDFEGELEVA